MNILFERLKDLRIDNDLNQSEMAEILKTTQTHFSKWEVGTAIIPLKKLNDICNYFDVSLDYMIGNTRTNKGNGKHLLNSKFIGKRLKEIRKKNGDTQKDVATYLNTTQSTISSYESGDTLILTLFAIQFCKKYSLSLDWLCGRIK